MTQGRALIIGYGSAGKRHARVLDELGLGTAVVSRRPIDITPAYQGIKDALEAERPGYVVVANETALHAPTLKALTAEGYRGPVLVEKPFSDRFAPPPDQQFEQLYVGYQLRFHPLLARLRELLAELRPVTVQAYVGQHLASWRPERPYEQSYSSHAEAGGGALRDLSHEIDLLLWLFGDWVRITALGGQHGVLNITSDDAYAVLMETGGCPMITLQVNYLDRVGRREMLINTDRATLHADLISGLLRVDGTEEKHSATRQDMDLAMHRAALNGAKDVLCTAAEGAEVMRTIEAAEVAATRRSWVTA